MKKLYFFALSLLSVPCMAQPQINKLFDYALGDQYIFRKLQAGTVIDTADIESRGTNLTWDMSNLIFESTPYTNTIIAYSASDFPTDFPGCTYVMEEYDGLQQFYRKNGDTVFYQGNSYGNSPNHFTPDVPSIIFPAQYGTNNNNVIGPVNTNVPGSGTWTYDGRYNAYGTLLLPGGISFPNVALYVGGGGKVNQYYDSYMWVGVNDKDPILRISYQHINGSSSIQYAYVTVAALSVTDKNNTISASLSPNPVADRLNITAKESLASVTLYDVSGRSLLVQKVNGKSLTVDMPDLPTGMYFVKMTSENGISETSKIIKE